MRLVLVRHGQTPSNIAGLIDTGAPGPGLSELGLRQAAAIPQAFRDHRIETMAVSNLLRTSLTAAPLAEARSLDPGVHEGLREIEAGDLEMLSDRDSVLSYIGTIFDWVAGNEQRRMPGGESGAEFFGRYDDAIEQIAGTGAESAVLVSHGAAIRAWGSRRVRGVDVEQVARTSLPNTGFVIVEGDPRRGWDLVEWSPHPAGGPDLMPVLAADPTAAPLAQGASRAEASESDLAEASEAG